ncbi:hypothetical protein AKJ44_01085 [candidate division MSBL1 archaeon SCGC-AAA261F17]|uniref:Uncharacterized protein n=1 Tax=candidate division MSBL1 archaeon SCGC-AAA261F17 TaxID=1698274 RepID=A0A133V6Y4_9EURY|nr:hypothetical protein AKJ44_01085 [candidate division MSBL1 archaeon SCGC-AAA261F17]
MEAWLLDLYPTDDDKMAIWLKKNDGKAFMLKDDYRPTLYVHGSRYRLRKLEPELEESESAQDWTIVRGRVRLRDPEKSEVLRIECGSMEDLVENVEPSMEDEHDVRWLDLYLPLERGGEEIAIPMHVIKLNLPRMDEPSFSVGFFKHSRYFEVERGDEEIDDLYAEIIGEAARFLSILREADGELIERLVPYDYREGKIKRKRVEKSELSPAEAEKIRKDYQEHAKKNMGEEGCSLNDYLDTASICYGSAFEEATSDKSSLELYEHFADFRHEGMLDLEDADSKSEFARWYESPE